MLDTQFFPSQKNYEMIEKNVLLDLAFSISTIDIQNLIFYLI